MARNIRWFVSFKSLNGTNCRVNIYDNDWPEGVTMGLRGAADPFYFEEDNSDDLLNDVLRYRTGYIRVIEMTYGGLNDIYPTSTFDRYVEFLYGGVVVFNGYIQVQDFDNTLEPGPREIELPVVSPMGLFHLRKFTRIVPPTTKTLGQLLDMALNNSTYQKVVVPDISGVGLWMTVYSLFVSPWNEDYHHSMTVAALNKVMKPESYAYLVESICKAFGWICHDTPEALVFTMFDHHGTYCNYPVGHIGDTNYKQTESIGTNAVDVADYFTLADDDAVINTILPDTGIEVNYEGHMGKMEFSFQRTTFSGVESSYPEAPTEYNSICNLHPIEGLYENNAGLYHTYDNDGYLVGSGAGTVVWGGNVGKEGILITGFDSAPQQWELFTIRLYVKHFSEYSWIFEYGCITSQPGVSTPVEDPETKQKHLSYTINHTTDYVEVTFYYVWQTEPLPEHFIIFIHDIKFTTVDVNGEPYAEYKYAPAKSSDLLPSTVDNPPVSSSVTMPISLYRLNDRMIGDTLRTTKLTEYPYLMQKRKELNGKFRLAQGIDLPHARMWSFMNKKWRLIAQTFRPWDDEFELTMQHSDTLDVSSYSITTNFENVTSNAPSSVDSGSSLFVTLSGVDGNKVQENSVVVMMGGVDITAIAYAHSTKTINIANVTGNISITAVGRPYDAEVEWLQSDGSAYIDTDFKHNQNTRIVCKLEHVGTVQTYSYPFGSLGGASGSNKLFTACVNGSSKLATYYGTGTAHAFNISGSGVHTFDMNKNAHKVDNSSYSFSTRTFSSSYNTLIFGMTGYDGTFTASKSTVRFYYFQIYDNGTLVRDFIPVKNNGVGYLYDKVSGTLYGNAGSGAFTFGNDVTT